MPSMEVRYIGGGADVSVKANVYRADDGRRDGGNVELTLGLATVTLPVWEAVHVAEMLLAAARTVSR